VGATGAVKMVDGKPDQDFYLVDILNKETLSKFNLGFTASAETIMSQNTDLKPVQGSLQNSNVDMIYNLSEMITTARGHSFNSKMISYQDELLKKATEEIGSLK
jgi:flagellar basal body rod protein FlgG